MTADTLARITEAIDADQRQTDVSNWPLSRERTRGYLALARAVASLADVLPDSGQIWPAEVDDVLDAFADLAPDADAGAVAEDAGTQPDGRTPVEQK